MRSYHGLLLLLALPLVQDVEERFAAAEAARLSDAREVAERRFLELLDDHPHHLAAHRSYQNLLLHLGREAQLLEAYRARREAEPDRALWCLLYGGLVPDPARAEEHYRAGLRLEPENAELHLALGQALRMQLRREEALSAFEEAARLEPDLLPAQTGTIRALHSLGQGPSAVERFRARFAAAPGEGRWQLLLGLALVSAGEGPEAIEVLRAFTDGQPEDVFAIAVLGLTNLHEGKVEAAREQAVHARELDPYDRFGLELASLVQGLVAGELDRALETAATFVRVEPTRSRAHALQGILLLQRGALAAAEDSFRRALRWDPVDVEALQGLAILARKRGDLREAIARYERVVEIDPRNLSELLALAELYGDAGEPEAAERTLARAEALRRAGAEEAAMSLRVNGEGLTLGDPGADAAWLRRRQAWAEVRAGRVDEALRALAQVLEAEPDAWAERCALARLLQGAGRTDEAIAEYERLSEQLLDTEHEGVGICSAIRAADLRWARGEREAAAAAYRDLLARFGERVPGHEHLDAIVAALEDPAEAPRRRVIEGLELERTEDPHLGAARALAAVLARQGLPADEQDLARRFERSELPYWRAVPQVLGEREDVDVFLFDGRWPVLRGLLDAGRPLLQDWGRHTATGTVTSHLAILTGYDEDLGVGLLEQDHLLAAMHRVPTRALERRATLLVTPRGALTEDEVAALPGRDVLEQMARALDAVMSGQPAAARAAVARAHELDPDHPGVVHQYALSRWATGEREIAVELLEGVRPVLRRGTEIPATLGRMLAELGRPAEAEEHLRAALLDEPRDASTHEALVVLLGGLPGRRQDAFAAADAFVDAVPTSGVARRARGVLLHQAGQKEAALDDFRGAALREPTARRFRDLGLLLGELERWEECARALERSVELEGDPAVRAQVEQILRDARARAGEE